VKERIQPRQVNIAQLQRILLAQRQTLFFYKDVLPTTPHFEAIQQIGMKAIDPGFEDFSFRPGEPATFAQISKYLFHGLKLPVKMDYTDLWKIMPSKNPKYSPHKGTQHCTPDYWATYYMMTLCNMGAFTSEALQSMDPDAPAQRADLVKWAAAAMKVQPESHAILSAETMKENGQITRGELAEFLISLMS
jgi:hypothetical protein